MTALVLNPSEVRRLLPMAKCIDLMADALSTLDRGEAANPLRTGLRLPAGNGLLGLMPGAMVTPGVFGIKVVAVMPGNHGTAYDSHQGVVVLFENRHGAPLAFVDASEITAIRTAAMSGLATRLLARDDAASLAILGSGVQGRSHLEAMLCVRGFRDVRVWSPTEARRRVFAESEGTRYGVEVTAAATAEEAVRGADVVCTTTSAKEPILAGDWLEPGVHVNAVGSSIATARELDTAAVVKSRLFIDRRESTLNEAGDFLFPKQEGAIGDDHIVAELGEILAGKNAGRRGPGEITLFKSLGLAVEDLVSAHWVYERAKAEGAGTAVSIGGPDGGD